MSTKSAPVPILLMIIVGAIMVVVGIIGWKQYFERKSATSTNTTITNAPTVTAADADVVLRLKPCLDAAPPSTCFEGIGKELIAEQGVPTMLATIERVMLPDAGLQSWCHPLAHAMGHVLYDEKKDIGQALEASGDKGVVCASGFYHGVVEEAAGTTSLADLQKLIPTVCQPFAVDRYSVAHYSCVHGLGHGLSAAHQDDWRAALVDCRLLADNWEHYSCASGVFMQNIVNRSLAGHEADFRADDPAYPCSEIDEYWTDACWINHTSYLVEFFAGDWSKVFATCAGIDEIDRPYCFRSSGRDLVGFFRGDDRTIVSLCLTAGAGIEKCLVGAAETYSYDTFSPVAGTRLCNLAPEQYQPSCMVAVNEFLDK